MISKPIDGISLVYAPDEQETAHMIASACGQALQLASDCWGLGPPRDCRIYVMTSAVGFVFRSAPWSWRLLLAATIPFWYARVRRTWPYIAAWTQRYGKRVAIGVKPARLLAQSKQNNTLRLGTSERVYVEEPDMGANLQNVTCHELVHACSAYLRLPAWLNEGLATVTVDRYRGRPTVRQESLALIRDHAPKAAPPTYRQMSRMDLEVIAYHGVRGYWLVRYLEETCQGMLKQLLADHSDGQAIEAAVFSELGMQPEQFWADIDELVVKRFEA